DKLVCAVAAQALGEIMSASSVLPILKAGLDEWCSDETLSHVASLLDKINPRWRELAGIVEDGKLSAPALLDKIVPNWRESEAARALLIASLTSYKSESRKLVAQELLKYDPAWCRSGEAAPVIQ